MLALATRFWAGILGESLPPPQLTKSATRITPAPKQVPVPLPPSISTLHPHSFILGALCPSQSGLLNKQTVKHIVKLNSIPDLERCTPEPCTRESKLLDFVGKETHQLFTRLYGRELCRSASLNPLSSVITHHPIHSFIHPSIHPSIHLPIHSPTLPR